MIISEAPYDKTLLIRQQVMYPDKDLDFVKLPDDEKGLHIGVYENEELMAVVSLFIEGREVQFRKLATIVEYQRRGYASALMKWLIDYANDIKLDRLWCNARKDAIGFYSQFGYAETNDTFSKNGYDYVVMEKKFNHPSA